VRDFKSIPTPATVKPWISLIGSTASDFWALKRPNPEKMHPIQKLRSFLDYPSEIKLLCLKTGIISIFVWIAVSLLPYRWWKRWQGNVRSSSTEEPDANTLRFRKNLSQAVSIASRNLPWMKRCYIRALTAKIMLERRGIRGTLYIGFRTHDDGRFEGHAWLRANDTWITGAERRGEFAVHGIYA
jgi:hypothetical protein